MGELRTWMAENRRVSVTLNLPELASLAEAAIAAGAGRRGADSDLDKAARRVIRARDRRLSAVQRARTS